MFMSQAVKTLLPAGFSDRRSGRVRREDAIRQAAAALRARQALDAISVAVMMVDRDFIVTQVNRSAVEFLTRQRGRLRKV